MQIYCGCILANFRCILYSANFFQPSAKIFQRSKFFFFCEFSAYLTCNVRTVSLVPRPSPAPVFDRLQKTEPEVFAYCILLAQFLHTASDQKPEPGKAWERGYVPSHYRRLELAAVSKAMPTLKVSPWRKIRQLSPGMYIRCPWTVAVRA